MRLAPIFGERAAALHRFSALSLLLLAMRGAPLGRVRPAEADELVALAAQHGLSAFLLSLDVDHQLPAESRERLKRASIDAATNHLRTQADLRRLPALLDPPAVPWAVVKGPVLAEHWYKQPGHRSYGDLDLLVDPMGLGAVLSALEDGGCRLLDTNWTLSRAQRRGELSLLLPHGTVLDLHWSLLNTPRLRTELSLNTAPLLSRRMAVTIAGVPVPTLDHVDTLVHLATHAMLSGGRQLSWYRDIEAVAGHHGLDWDELVLRAQASQGGLLTAVALERAAALTTLHLPPRVVGRLAPHGTAWRTLLRALDRWRPLGETDVGVFSGQLVAAAGRDTTGASLRSLLGGVRRDLVSPLLHDPDHPWRARGRTREVPSNPLWQPAASPDDRGRYLAEVCREASATGGRQTRR